MKQDDNALPNEARDAAEFSAAFALYADIGEVEQRLDRIKRLRPMTISEIREQNEMAAVAETEIEQLKSRVELLKPKVTDAKPAKPASSKVGWKKSVDAAWDAMLRLHNGKPTVEQLVRYLENNDTEGFIVPSGITDELAWRPSRGCVKKKTVSARTIQDYIGTLPAAPRT